MASNYSSSDDENIIPSPTPSPPRKEENQSRVRRTKTIAVEGNIGCGKTTFLSSFSMYNNVEVLPEPVDKWKDVMGINALDLMYKDAGRWGGAFQSMVTLSMLDHHSSSKKPSGVKLIERSIYSTRYCFMQNLFDNGLMPPMEFAMLGEVHDWVKENEHIQLDLIVYLRASPETCAERIKKRNRAEECDVPMDYLSSLHRLHDDWLLLGKKGPLPCPILVIDANKNQEDLQREIDNLKQDILAGVADPLAQPQHTSTQSENPAPQKLFSHSESSASQNMSSEKENDNSQKCFSQLENCAPKKLSSQSENLPASQQSISKSFPLSPPRSVLKERNSNY